ncbi:MAG: ACT domain-containing protein [Candidatus Omnitrophica bacterium]|nr:ACT domain-containing protein [Candidatus Omnitrophota bacterium]
MAEVKMRKQLSVFLSNRPGELSRLCGVLRDNNVNMQGISVHDAIDHCLVRIVVDNPTKASLLLEREEWHVTEQNVVMVSVMNVPGALGKISQKLAEADINICYAYASALPGADEAMMILNTDANERAVEALQ